MFYVIESVSAQTLTRPKWHLCCLNCSPTKSTLVLCACRLKNTFFHGKFSEYLFQESHKNCLAANPGKIPMSKPLRVTSAVKVWLSNRVEETLTLRTKETKQACVAVYSRIGVCKCFHSMPNFDSLQTTSSVLLLVHDCRYSKECLASDLGVSRLLQTLCSCLLPPLTRTMSILQTRSTR